MKKTWILTGIFLVLLAAGTLAASSDYFIKEQIDISSHLTNPRALAVIPGGFVVIDWESAATVNAYILDRQGNLLNETNNTVVAKINLTANASYLGHRITGIRLYNSSGNEKTFAVLDDTRKNITLLNSSDFDRVFPDFQLPSPGKFGSTDVLAGFCTNGSDFWTATADRQVITRFAGGGNNSVNQSEFTLQGTSTAGGFDCINANTSQSIVLDGSNGIAYITSPTAVKDTINLSNIASRGLNTFSDIALLNDPYLNRPDFYALNNATKTIYHFQKRPPSILNIYAPNISFTHPTPLEEFNSRFYKIPIQINFSAVQGNNSISQFRPASDRLNCTIFVNDTANFSIANTPNNISINNSVNITFADGVFDIDVRCLANVSYAKEKRTGKVRISKKTFRHVVWMSNNFSLYYDDDSRQLVGYIGTNTTPLSADYNLTPGEHLNIKVIWNNDTGNRSMYVNGDLLDSDTHYSWTSSRYDRIYFGSQNISGQINGIVSFIQISNKASASAFKTGSFIDSWTSSFKKISGLTSAYFFQIKAILSRGLTSERPVLRFVNVSFDDTLMNYTIEPEGVDFLDFGFSSGTSSAVPAGQSASIPIFTIWNTGNKSFNLQAYSDGSFSSCFTAGLFNQSDMDFAGGNNTINLSTTPQTIATLGSGKKANVWMNVSASGCSANSEFFNIQFTTSP